MEFIFANLNRFTESEMMSLQSTAQLFTQLSLSNPSFASVVGVDDLITVDTDVFAPTQWDFENNRLILSHSTFDGYYSDSYTIAGGVFRDINRIIFHELAHRATTDPSTVSSFALKHNGVLLPVSLTEAFAIFAENAIFDPIYAPAGESYGARAGHSLWGVDSAATGGVSGLEAFNWFSSSQGTSLQKAPDGVHFRRASDDGKYSAEKIYHPTINIDNQDYSHYITVSAINHDGFINKNGTSYGLDSTALPVIDSLMGGKSSSVASAISLANKTISDFDLESYYGQTSILGLSGERYYSLGELGSVFGWGGTKYMFDFIGLGYRIHDYSENNDATGSVVDGSIIGVIHQRYNNVTQNSIVIGAAGFGFNLESTDNIVSGSGNDFIISNAAVGGNVLHGGSGNDLIIGSTKSGDQLFGDAGDDLFIARGASNFYDGGADKDILSYHNQVSSAPITLNSEFQAISSRLGTENYASIETLIGTPGADVFNLSAGHPAIYGGVGGDKFYGQPTSSIDGGLGIDILDLWDGSGGVIDGTLLNGIETIYGSGGNDVLIGNAFRNAQSIATFLGYGGNDVIEQSGTMNINIDGGADNDTVIVLGESYGYLRGGTGFDTLDFSQLQANRLVVTLADTNGTYKINTGSAHSFSSFEEVKFGSVTLQLHGSGTFTAGTGHNTVSGSDGVDNVTVGGTGGYVRTYGGDDIIHSTGLESVYGEMGNDRLFAGDTVGAKLHGGVYPDQAVTWVNDGDDFLQGGAMSDTLSGGTGNNELRGGGGYDHFYSGGYGENSVYGEGDLGAMHYSFVARGGHPSDPDLMSIEDMGGWFDVKTTSDDGQTYRTDHLYDIDKVFFEDMTFNLYSGLTYYNPDFLI